MESFRYISNELCCEQVPLRQLVEQYGTPLYVYSQEHLTGQFQKLDKAFRGLDHMICYAVKANSNLAVIRVLARLGAGFDIVSAGELLRVIKAGGDPRKCVFSGVGKTREEIDYAIENQIFTFNIECESELELINDVAVKRGVRAPVSLRVNPDVDPHTHHYISTGKQESKFGIAIGRALDVYREAMAMPGIAVRGVQMHIGSQITSTSPFLRAVKKMAPLVRAVKALSPDTVQAFDIGGGLGIRYRNENPPTAAEYASAVMPHLRPLGLKILMEPGRFIAGNSGVLVTRVVHIKKTPNKKFVVIDAAMNDLIRPALYSSYHEIVPVARTKAKTITADVVGPICETGDFFAQARKIPSVNTGDLLSVMSAGAYGMTMASQYNSRQRPAEVLVDGKVHDLIRSRDTMEDLVAGEMIPKRLK